MNTTLTTIDRSALAEQVAVAGDLSALSPDQRMTYYGEVCQSLGLNPFTRPFEYIKLNGKLVLYAKKEAGDQLRTLHGVSITKVDKQRDGDLYVVTAYARDKTGREDADVGIVTIKGLAGEALANAMMKTVTKAKRRVTLAICGLGWLDETEVETIPNAQPVTVTDAGEVVDPPQAPPRATYKQPAKKFNLPDWLDWFRAAKPDNQPATLEEIDAACTDWDTALGKAGSAAIVVAWATNGQGFEDIGSHAMNVLSTTATSSKFTDADCQLIQKAAQMYVDNLPVEQPEADADPF